MTYRFNLTKTIALGLLPGAAFVAAALAIPNQVGVGFINLAGMRLEDFAAQPAVWERDAKLAGDWKLWRDDSVKDTAFEVLKLEQSAVVFGVDSSEVVLWRREGKLERLTVRFESDRRGNGGFETLERNVRTNLSIWADSGSSKGEGGEIFSKGAVEILLQTDAREKTVRAIFTRSPRTS
ncbi:MAG: hypothetical protein KDM91_23040 [Verrucomicrobiae bacterium]|nr:hypothetical protein [Verrucomicrobiae bacterium]